MRIETPAPKKDGPKRTASRKRKSVRWEEIVKVSGRLLTGGKDGLIAARFMVINTYLGLRPIEWQTASIEGTMLVVRCAKRTNGRGLADVRRLNLAGINRKEPSFCSMVQSLIDRLQIYRSQSRSWKNVWDRIARRIASACHALKIRRISLYTTRHACIATAKQSMSAVAVAVLAGHASDRTATVSYGKRRTGLAKSISVALPQAEAEKLVRRSGRSNLDERAEFRAAKDFSPKA
ncbi:hypothetical protein [Notoacmeibacter ruber]|uniref:hypothetical protein n=1 Tax=Notoacmeibacter ruber TaxID=2670375 RepID=UPI0011C45367|nr:hypothetical protein [Notoacmeibacter ruber]